MKTPVGVHMLAYLFKLPADWLEDEARAGRLPCLKIGKKLLFHPPAVKAALAERAARERVGAAR